MDIDEGEIKIEYYENLERDPLQDDNYNVTEQNEDFCNNSIERTEFCEDEDAYHQHEKKPLNIHKNLTWYNATDKNGKLLCKYCELKYSTVQTLRHHIKNKHPKEAQMWCRNIINNKRNSKCVCHICKKRFKDLPELKHHMGIHSLKLVQMSCMDCNATFKNTENLAEHVYMTHQKASKITYTCSICGYRTLKKSHYKQHNNIHKENKSLTCNYCEYKTNYLPNLKIHERIHTNDKPYMCDVKNCDYRSAAKSALKSHQLKHFPEENMLFCDKCNYSTVYKQSLKKHSESHVRNFIRIQVK